MITEFRPLLHQKTLLLYSLLVLLPDHNHHRHQPPARSAAAVVLHVSRVSSSLRFPLRAFFTSHPRTTSFFLFLHHSPASQPANQQRSDTTTNTSERNQPIYSPTLRNRIEWGKKTHKFQPTPGSSNRRTCWPILCTDFHDVSAARKGPNFPRKITENQHTNFTTHHSLTVPGLGSSAMKN